MANTTFKLCADHLESLLRDTNAESGSLSETTLNQLTHLVQQLDNHSSPVMCDTVSHTRITDCIHQLIEILMIEKYPKSCVLYLILVLNSSSIINHHFPKMEQCWPLLMVCHTYPILSLDVFVY